MDDTSRAAEAPPVLEVRGLHKRYGAVEALRELDLTVRAGEVYGFLGRNGAGKSTTIRIVMGITRPSGGEVRLFGEPLGRDPVRLRQRIGYVAQEQHFYPWMTPVALGRFVGGFYPTWDPGEFERLTERLELPRRRKVGTFSGGMKVKLALALALAHRPRLLVLDEPTAGLDPVARREFLEMVRDQAEQSGRTTFFSTHLIDEVDLAAHRVGIVDGGRTRFEGPVEELAARIRLLTAPAAAEAPPPELPPALVYEVTAARVLQDRVREGRREVVVQLPPGAAWDAVLEGDEAGWRIEELPLEELFIELVRRPLEDGTARR